MGCELRRLMFPLSACLAATLLLGGCSEEPPASWADMTGAQKAKVLRAKLESAQAAGKRHMNGDLKLGIEELLAAAEKSPSPEFTPVLKEAAETAVEYRFFQTASRAYEDAGDWDKAVEYAQKFGDMERARDLLVKKEQIKPGDGNAAEAMRIQVALDSLAKAEKMYESERDQPNIKILGNKPARTIELLAKAQKDLEGVGVSEADYQRLLRLQIELADGTRGAEKVAREAEWTPPRGLSSVDGALRRAGLWSQMASKSDAKLAPIFVAKADAVLKEIDQKSLTPEQKKQLMETFYASARFADALALARELFASDEGKLSYYKLAAAHKSVALRDQPIDFPVPGKSATEQTYVTLYSPSGGYTANGDEVLISDPGALTWETPEKGQEGPRLRFKGDEGTVYMLAFTGGYRRGLKPGIYDNVNEIGYSPAEPGIGFEGKTKVRFGQFIVHEVEWSDEKPGQVSRVAIDFCGSETGRMSDVCYGKLRYRAHFE